MFHCGCLSVNDNSITYSACLGIFFCRLLPQGTESSAVENQPGVPESKEHAVSGDEHGSTEVSRIAPKGLPFRSKSAGSSHKTKSYNWSTEEMKMLERLQNSLLEAVGRMRYNYC